MKPNIISFISITTLLFLVGLLAFQSDKNSINDHHIKSEIKSSEQKVKTYQKEYDSLQQAYSSLEKQKQKVKTLYVKGKETIQYITKERLETYTDTLCKKDVLKLKNQISVSDSLIALQNTQQLNTQNQLTSTENTLREKEKQIGLYKSKKTPPKPLGIGIIGGYGTDFQHGLSPFWGVGISYSFIRF